MTVKRLFKVSTGKWTFRFGHSHIHFKFLSGGRILFGKKKVKFTSSKIKVFPASKHWITFIIGRYVYYIQLGHSAVVYKFSNKKIKGCKHTMKGVKKLYYCGKGSGKGKNHKKHVKKHKKSLWSRAKGWFKKGKLLFKVVV